MSDAVRQAQAIQREAATPDRQVVLEAAAGSGKTKVLVDRFLRLCLTGEGVDPRAVLAITFTRRATIEIQDRLQAKARRLAGLGPDQLRDALTDIIGRPPTDAELTRGAWFHEDLLEDPSGLGIDTLHAFCQKVLGRFAAEVGLDPRFSVLDERQEADYRAEALDRLEATLVGDPEAAAAYTNLTSSTAGARKKVAGVFNQRVHLQRWLDRVAPPAGSVAAVFARPLAPHHEALQADLRTALLAGTPWRDDPSPDLTTLAGPLAAALTELAGPGLALVEAEEGGASTEGFKKQFASIQSAALSGAAELAGDRGACGRIMAEIGGLLLTGKGEKLRVFKGRNATKDVRQSAFARVAGRVLELLQLPPLLELLDRNATVLRLGLGALDLYASAKRRDRVVDFQDLEYLALRLLTDPDVGPQVHFRLDARLDHLLLDEFQDTNRNQWELLEPLLGEVLAGGDPPRTAFVVGDVKQSIYGFRGAEPDVFAGADEFFTERTGADPLLRLPTNFRSLPAIVDTVGDLFQHEPLAGYLGAEAAGAVQESARNVARGEVTFVRAFERDGDDGGHERAAAAVADHIRGLLDPAAESRTWTWDAAAGRDEPRALRPDDILVLARTKTHLAVYEAALRRAGIPFLPAGRGLLARSREVQDILALLRWLGHPADDTAGATVLRSPCFRVPEPVVQELLATRRSGRRRSLREVLRSEPCLATVSERLENWFGLAGLQPLHDLLRRVVRDGDLLARFETAGGEQARFNVQRLFDLALTSEARGGSLRDFVAELDQADRLGGEEEGALPGEDGKGRVRVMTVHGAKGLEAPVVILADAAAPLRETTETLLLARQGDGPWLQDVRKIHCAAIDLQDGESLDPPLAPAHQAALQRAMTEEAHILYVALTRARDRLVVVGGRGKQARRGEDYLDWLARAGADLSERWQDADTFLADRAGATRTQADTAPSDPAARAATAASRTHVWTPPPLRPRYTMAAPSRLDDDRTPSAARAPVATDDPGTTPLPADRRDTPATRRGTRIHAWLERACTLGSFPDSPAATDHRDEWVEARAVWQDAALDWVFRPETTGCRGFSEVPVLHRRDDARVTGFIDRLVLSPDHVDIVDYKSNRVDPAGVAALAEHYGPQLQAYREALTTIYPDRTIRCWLIWTCAEMASARVTEVTDP